MKKLMFAVAACAVVFGLEAVESNVVGYQNKVLSDDNYTMVMVPFTHVNGDGKGLDLNTDIKIDGLTGSDVSETLADRIWIWDGVMKYDCFFFYDDGEGGDPDEWCDEKDWGSFYEYADGKYANGLPEGAAMYILTKGSGKTLIGSGAVEEKDECEYPLSDDNYNMVGNPYPVFLDVNDKDQFEIDGLTGSDVSETLADRIWIWDGVMKYDCFFFYDDGEGGDPDEWCDDKDWCSIKEYADGKYADGIPSGTGMYILTKGQDKSVIFKKPF